MTPALLLCAVPSVTDGDTLRADCAGTVERIRIANIDAPETRSPGCVAELLLGEWATRTAEMLLSGETIEIRIRYRDRWGRAVADVQALGGDLATVLLDAGLALPWPHDDEGRATAPRPDWCAGNHPKP